jgi:hypothetical protein
MKISGPSVAVHKALIHIAVFALTVLPCLSIADAAYAQKERSYTPPYGMAGCGIGSIIITENKNMPQLGAAWIEILAGGLPFVGISFQKTWAITTGTSNCEDRPGAVAQEQEVFAEANYAALSNEAAMGQGPTLDAWAELLGCEGPARDTLQDMSQKQHDQLYSGGSHEMVSAYLELIREKEDLEESCLNI